MKIQPKTVVTYTALFAAGYLISNKKTRNIGILIAAAGAVGAQYLAGGLNAPDSFLSSKENLVLTSGLSLATIGVGVGTARIMK